MERKQYWASIDNPDELLDVLENKIRVYYDDLRNTGLIQLWRRVYRAYYGGRVTGRFYNTPLFESSQLISAGKQGEKTKIKVNHYRNLIRHSVQLITTQTPAIRTRATNSDYRSQAQTVLGNGLVDYYWREKNVANFLRDSVEVSWLYAEAFVLGEWNPQAGEIYAVDGDGNPIYEGDQEYAVFSPIDVIRDPALKSNEHQSWNIVRKHSSRWDLLAKYSAHADAIYDAPAVDANDDESPVFQLRGGNDPENEDLVHEYVLFHDKTEALPQGRLVIFIKGAILFDGPLPYPEIPVYRLAPETLLDTIYGYTFAYDLLGIQEGIDELHSILMSNNKTFGSQAIWVRTGERLTEQDLSGGLKVIRSDEEPKPVQLTRSAPETYQYLEMLEKAGETISGIPSTVRGQPEANLRSGNALALVVSQAIQFMNGLEESYNRLIEKVGTNLITNLRLFSKTKRVANIIGESSRPFMKEFTSEDLSQINRVVVERANPLSKTTAGKVEIANNLLQQGFIKTPEQYITVLTTGQLDPAIEGTQHALLNVRAENEDLQEGQEVIAVVTEDHALHIREHKIILENPEVKRNPELVQRILAHIQEHLDLWRSADPAILMITGQQPPPPPPGMMVPPPEQGGPVPPEMLDSTPQIVQEAGSTTMPNIPSLPEGTPPEAEAAYEKVLAPPA